MDVADVPAEIAAGGHPEYVTELRTYRDVVVGAPGHEQSLEDLIKEEVGKAIANPTREAVRRVELLMAIYKQAESRGAQSPT